MLRTGQLHRAPPRPRNLARRRRPRYRGPWRLPGPDSHRLAAVSLSLGYVVVLLLSVLLGARATGRTFLRNRLCGGARGRPAWLRPPKGAAWTPTRAAQATEHSWGDATRRLPVRPSSAVAHCDRRNRRSPLTGCSPIS